MTRFMELHVRGSEHSLFKGNPDHLAVYQMTLSALTKQVALCLRDAIFDTSTRNELYSVLCAVVQSGGDRGLNTTIFRPEGAAKASTFLTISDSQASWAQWAEWVRANSEQGDLLALSTADALRDPFLPGIEETARLYFNRLHQDPVTGWVTKIPGITLDIVVPAIIRAWSPTPGDAVSAAEGVAAGPPPGPSVPRITSEQLTALRTRAETLASVGSTLGTGYALDPPSELVAEPLSLLISERRLPQYALMKRVLEKVINNTLALDKALLGDFGQFDDLALGILNVFVTVRNPNVEFVKGKPGMIGVPGMETVDPDKDGNNLATPENHSLRITGDVELLGLDATLTAEFFQHKNKPSCSFKFALAKPLGLGTFLPDIPLVSGMEISGPPALVACTVGTLYDPGFDSGINTGINFFGNIEVAESKDATIRFLGELLRIKRFAVHAAVDTSSKPPAYIFEGAVQRDITLIDGGSFVLRFTRSDISITVKGRPPEPAIGLSSDLVLTLLNGGEETHLVFTGGIKIEPESITGSFTMNGTGRSPQGALSGTVQNTGEWKEPFGIPGVVIRQMAVQMGCTYVAPWIDNIGIHGSLKIGNVEGSISILVDSNDADQFVLAGSIDRITLIQLLSAMSPGTFAAYQLIDDSVKKVMNQVVDVAMENVKVSIVPVACSIGGVHFRDEGVTVMGRLSLWGWKASAFVNVDTFDGITVRGDMDPLDIAGVFKITGAQGDAAPILRVRVSPFAVPDVYISGNITLLGLSRELKISADETGLSFFLQDRFGEILTTKLACQYSDSNFRGKGSIDFRLNVTIPTVFGDIPLVDVSFDAATELRVGRADGFYASIGGSFTFWGGTVSMPTLTLRASPGDFEDLFNAVLNQIKDRAGEIFGAVWKTLEEWGNAIKDGLIWFGGEIADVAKTVYHATAEAAIQVYESLGKGANEIARGLNVAYSWTVNQVATVLRTLGYWADEVTQALQVGFHASKQAIKAALEAAGYAWTEIEEGLKTGFTVIGAGAVEAAETVGNFVKDDVGDFFKNDVADAFGF